MRKRLALSLIVSLAFLVGALLIFWRYPERIPVVRDWIAPDDVILIIGLDEGNRADSILLVYPRKTSTWVLALPRDTYCSGGHKLNGLYKRLGAERFTELVASIIGHPVDYYIVVPFKKLPPFLERAFPEGLEIHVPYRLRYTDRAAGFRYDIPAGKRRLSAQELGWFLRDRFSDPKRRGDIARIERWQIFARAAFAELRKPSQLGRLRKIATDACSTFPTNLSVYKAAALAQVVARSTSLHSSVLPSRPITVRDVSYVQLDKSAAHRQAHLATKGIYVPPSVCVYVLNGTKQQGLARTYARYISVRFGVYSEAGNARSLFERVSTVTYTSPLLAPLAEEIAGEVGISRVLPHSDKIESPAIFIVLGSDLEARKLAGVSTEHKE